MDLIAQYRMMHDAGHFAGHSLGVHIKNISVLIQDTKSRTILDYGSGKGQQYVNVDWPVTLYDPGVKGIDEKPQGKFDGVICTDVLEHIPEDDLEKVIGEIFGYAEKFVFLSICTREAKKVLPDGRNCHLTVKPELWWLSLIARLNPGLLHEVQFNE